MPQTLPTATCRHCGKPVFLRGEVWCDEDGIPVCIRGRVAPARPDTPPAGAFRVMEVTEPVLHEPMPAGLRGAA